MLKPTGLLFKKQSLYRTNIQNRKNGRIKMNEYISIFQYMWEIASLRQLFWGTVDVAKYCTLSEGDQTNTIATITLFNHLCCTIM